MLTKTTELPSSNSGARATYKKISADIAPDEHQPINNGYYEVVKMRNDKRIPLPKGWPEVSMALSLFIVIFLDMSSYGRFRLNQSTR